MDYRLNTKLPRGIRNNNPGNLVLTAIKWKGKIPNDLNKDGKFEQFENIYLGSRALVLDLSNDIKKGQDTINELIKAYAPPSENDTLKYVNFVSKQTGFAPNEKLMANKDTLSKLFKAIVIMENGIKDVNSYNINEWFTEGYNLAFKKKV